MNPIIAGAATVTAISTIGGGALYLNELHVASEDFQKYIESQESRYVLELKKEIRQVKESLKVHDDDYLEDLLDELIDTLCELRPDDKVCRE